MEFKWTNILEKSRCLFFSAACGLGTRTRLRSAIGEEGFEVDTQPLNVKIKTDSFTFTINETTQGKVPGKKRKKSGLFLLLRCLESVLPKFSPPKSF